MAINPYAPPTAEVAPPAPPVPVFVPGPDGWTVRDVLRESWRAYRRNWLVLTFAPLIYFGTSGVQEFVLLGVRNPVARGVILAVVISFKSTIEAGWTLQWLSAARGEVATLGQIGRGFSRAVPLVGMTLLEHLTSGFPNLYVQITSTNVSRFALLLLSIPYCVSESWVGIARCVAVAEDASALGSLREAWRRSAGVRGRLLLLGLAGYVIATASILLCVVGLLLGDALAEGLPVVVYLWIGNAATRAAVQTGDAAPPESASVA
jgi:hypothetical protein